MATRCNIIVRSADGSESILYRHWDGYPASTGLHLARLLRVATRRNWGAARFTAALLESRERNVCRFTGERRHHYEVTDGIHEDVEHIYCVTFEPARESNQPRIGHAPFPISSHDWKGNAHDRAADRARKACVSLAKFADKVIAPAVADMNFRITARNVANNRPASAGQVREFRA